MLSLIGCQQNPPQVETALGAQGSPPLIYTNPLTIRTDRGRVETCADPDIVRGQTSGDTDWYLYCTSDPHSGSDRDAAGNLIFHPISMAKSSDLVNWTYMGDALPQKPAWVRPDAGLWAPDVNYLNGKYYLYYTASDTVAGGSAIGVATSDTPLGPWADSGAPVVEPHPAPCCPGSRRWTFDPAVIQADDGQKWIYYGSYFGGISVRKLSADGLHSDAATQTQVASANRYEASFVFRHDGYYYLFVSSTDCCRGPLTGYSVFAGRSLKPDGPFVDRDGVDLNATYVGGTPVISMNGNRWVGPGHNAVFTDAAGQDWTVYHAINRVDPYLAEAGGINKRPALLDPLDWVNGWPTVRGGLWASDGPMLAPAAQPGDRSRYRTSKLRVDVPGKLLGAYGDEFNAPTLSPSWTWVRPPAAGVAALENGAFRFYTQNADLFEDSNNASVLVRAAPQDDYLVETRLTLNLPPEGCCFNYAQAGLVVYTDDDRYIKLAQVSIFETRQIEFGKEVAAGTPGFPRYGNTVLSAGAETIWLRIARRHQGGEEHYTAYSSRDGRRWTRGGTWMHALGASARIGLVSLGGSGFTARFDYVRVYDLKQKQSE
ncbi:family 43 glycosylhydrolase [Deinococcus sp.]|uniref:family 43 glycosylhydrolase n=1 Tax=Deinococcus sp. TaxID=47478 RepID=UPI002869ACCD|nr:family 43 glycosylhydrolase [Deinococcus sp.]